MDSPESCIAPFSLKTTSSEIIFHYLLEQKKMKKQVFLRNVDKEPKIDQIKNIMHNIALNL